MTQQIIRDNIDECLSHGLCVGGEIWGNRWELEWKPSQTYHQNNCQRHCKISTKLIAKTLSDRWPTQPELPHPSITASKHERFPVQILQWIT